VSKEFAIEKFAIAIAGDRMRRVLDPRGRFSTTSLPTEGKD
jgi:hypothetical protein